MSVVGMVALLAVRRKRLLTLMGGYPVMLMDCLSVFLRVLVVNLTLSSFVMRMYNNEYVE